MEAAGVGGVVIGVRKKTIPAVARKTKMLI
jgi:hypothetical protein